MLESSLAPKAFAELRRLEGQIRARRGRRRGWNLIEPTWFDGLVTGLTRGERVTLKGSGPAGEREFDFEPYTLLFWRNGLYVAGYSHHHKAVRLFGLDKLNDGEWKRGESFEVPDGWDARARYGLSPRPLRRPRDGRRVRFSAKMARYATRHQWTRNQRVEEHADGRVIVTVIARGTIDVTNWVLGFGEYVACWSRRACARRWRRWTRRMAAAYETTE